MNLCACQPRMRNKNIICFSIGLSNLLTWTISKIRSDQQASICKNKARLRFASLYTKMDELYGE